MRCVKGNIILLFLVSILGCGYTQRLQLPGNIQTIYIETFKDEIPPDQRYANRPGVEIELTNALIDRFIFDGNLKVVKEEKADAVMRGSVISFKQEGVRFDDFESIEEYRLFLVVSFELEDQRNGTLIVNEPNFSGRSEYFTSRTSSSSRSDAGSDVVVDLARNIVDRIVEEW